MARGFIRKPSLRKSISARTSPKRIIKNALGIRVPRGYGFLTNPKKYVYNKVYTRTSVSIFSIFKKLLK